MKKLLSVLMVCTFISCSTDRVNDIFSVTPNCTNGWNIYVFSGADDCSGESNSINISVEELIRIREYLGNSNIGNCVPVTVSPLNPDDDDIEGYVKISEFDPCSIGSSI